MEMLCISFAVALNAMAVQSEQSNELGMQILARLVCLATSGKNEFVEDMH